MNNTNNGFQAEVSDLYEVGEEIVLSKKGDGKLSTDWEMDEFMRGKLVEITSEPQTNRKGQKDRKAYIFEELKPQPGQQPKKIKVYGSRNLKFDDEQIGKPWQITCVDMDETPAEGVKPSEHRRNPKFKIQPLKLKA